MPARCWKVVILTTGTHDATRGSISTRVIAVDMPNDSSISTSWGIYRTSVDAIESATGYDLHSIEPTAVQQTVEARTATSPTS